MKTEFAEVMRLFRRSEANGIYIIYNIYSDHSFTGDTSHHYTGDPWGHLGETEMKFSCAKIADKISDLDLFRPYELTTTNRDYLCYRVGEWEYGSWYGCYVHPG